MKRFFGLVCSLAVALIGPATAAPLLIEGKTLLHQRVLSRPGAELKAAKDMAAEVLERLNPFEIFYVFERTSAGGENWIRVGRSKDQDGVAWMKESEAVDWKQTIVAAFTNPAGRAPALIFESKEALKSVYRSEDVAARVNRLRNDARVGALGADSPIVSIEPETFIDIDQQFYILPILSHETIRMPTPSLRGKLLEIASVSKQPASTASQNPQAALADYNVGIVFVIDTTSSMGPYIEQLREAVASIQQRIGDSEIGDKVRFGLVGFRDNTSLVPALEYTSRYFLPLSPESTSEKFLSAMNAVAPAEVSSTGFDEDAIAGVKTALDETDWAPFGGRYIILISDAGPREPGELAKHGPLQVSEVAGLLGEKGIATYVMHLQTEAGRHDHDYARSQYMTLSRFQNGTPLYFGVPDGDVGSFRSTVESLSNKLINQITDAIAGRLAEVDPSADPIDQSAALVGRAMQLAYLGRTTGTAAPPVLIGAVTDLDPLEQVFALEPRIMVTRNELSTMRDIMTEIVALGNQAIIDGGTEQFFTQLRDAVARISRTSSELADVETIGDAIGEYFEDLPYTSVVGGIDQQQWLALPAPREREIIDGVSSKLTAIDAIYRDSSRWIALYEGSPEGEHVTTLPLKFLP